ncbi:hypothetical protein F8O07_07165 [Pseudoclavibacter sp. CFCC 13796]|uniref:hypothetical protein n=1 Tax=Pseudoclavibacter sp. CFCC 13796 TaxID=2615179 RepID=UPI0013014500|nr:hypothetical protein [Pseudoclavibacter sp. CFCC 13796]KAB1661677.1 hypothetical protein F8O07_07165 [Pseudoclavibacter sp. CFCC 13796]
MSAFDPAQHPRGSAGQFRATEHTPAELRLGRALEASERSFERQRQPSLRALAEQASDIIRQHPEARYAVRTTGDSVRLLDKRWNRVGTATLSNGCASDAELIDFGLVDREDEGLTFYLRSLIDQHYEAQQHTSQS